MCFADTCWYGNLPINNMTYEFMLNISPTMDSINISFPQCCQMYLPIENYWINKNTLTISLNHIGEKYKLVFSLAESSILNGVVFSYASRPTDFYLIYKSRYITGKTIYQPWPHQNKLLKNLVESGDVDFSKLDILEYPNLNSKYFSLMNDLYGFNNFFASKSSLERAILLMRWVNKAIKQAGMIVLPIQRDGLSLLNYALQGNKELNCKGCSLILTDCLMSIGVLARTVHCMSSNAYDPESHYITEMYYKEKDKWIALDAAFGCYFEYDNEILGIEEIRKLLVSNQEILFKAYKNTINVKYKNKIKYGLIKNFYRFEYYSNYNPGYASLFSKTKKLLLEPSKQNAC